MTSISKQIIVITIIAIQIFSHKRVTVVKHDQKSPKHRKGMINWP